MNEENRVPTDKTALCRRLYSTPFTGWLQHTKPKGHAVDRNNVRTRIILQLARKECLREKEPANPINRRRASRDPIANEVQSSAQIYYPGGQWL